MAVIGTPFKAGNGGRPKGSQNKLTKTVKETVLAVFNELQDDPKNSLQAFAEKYPRDFYQIAAKLIPTELTGAGGNDLFPPVSDNQIDKIISALKKK